MPFFIGLCVVGLIWLLYIAGQKQGRKAYQKSATRSVQDDGGWYGRQIRERMSVRERAEEERRAEEKAEFYDRCMSESDCDKSDKEWWY